MDSTAKNIIVYAQNIIESINIARQYGDKYNAIAPLTVTLNSYMALYKRLTGKNLILVDGKVTEEV